MRLSRALAILAVASPLGAQPSLGLEYRAMYTDNEVIADPAGIRASVGASKGRGAIWFAVERLKGVQRRFGNGCTTPAAGCPDEPLLDTASIAGGELGYGYPLTKSARHSVDASLALRVTRMAVRTHSLSGFILSTDEFMLGPELGVDVLLIPPGVPRLGITLGARLTALAKFAPEVCRFECYQPITSMRTHAFHAGIRWVARRSEDGDATNR